MSSAWLLHRCCACGVWQRAGLSIKLQLLVLITGVQEGGLGVEVIMLEEEGGCLFACLPVRMGCVKETFLRVSSRETFLRKGGGLAGMECLAFIVLISDVITHSRIYVWLSLGLHCFNFFLILGALVF